MMLHYLITRTSSTKGFDIEKQIKKSDKDVQAFNTPKFVCELVITINPLPHFQNKKKLIIYKFWV